MLSNLDYYAQHGIWGAFASFSLGKYGRGGGFSIGDVKIPAHNLYVGYANGKGQPTVMPWLDVDAHYDGSTAFTAKRAAEFSENHREFSPAEIDRHSGLGTEVYRAGRMSLALSSFYGSVPNPNSRTIAELRKAYCPTIQLSLTFDNQDSKDSLVGFFGMQAVMRVLSDSTQGQLLGLAYGTRYGFAVAADERVQEVLDWDCLNTAFGEDQQHIIKRLSEEGGLRFEVAAGEKRTFKVILGVHESGVVTTVLPTQRFYSSLFRDLEDVLTFGLSIFDERVAKASEMDGLLEQASLNAEQKLFLSNAVRSYNASTELLLDSLGRPLFIVNEGEYRMMNTLDLTVDQVFWELIFSPWTVKNELEFILERSSYTDDFGLAFCHDQGVADTFSLQGFSSYELPGLVDCFSYMSYEETLNWSLCGCLYATATKDWQWARKHAQVFVKILTSIQARDRDGDGIMDQDSSRCNGGAEITTYDSLDISLGQARNNLYLAVKAWGAMHALSSLFEEIEHPQEAGEATALANNIAQTVSSYFLEDERYIPAVFESGNRSKIIPAVEGLIYPYLCSSADILDLDGPNKKFLGLLIKHLETVLQPGACIDENSGGWKLSSTSNNTWLSKIFLNQFVAAQILGIDQDLVRKDREHAKWVFGNASIYGMVDQVDSADGRDLGSRNYPRLVTAVLWLLECGALPHLAPWQG